ncbi:hypothetical protein [Epilithonimonas arachidiradicis]|uniref:Uncharacterized protein n=1 Tax=Epilithonimonas arachidiradicis TaxID=1617282 RepID=A0A420DB19_9FLAO|nr:hypothetical protein [Epilithonimonas arachidiradicis]RKE88393.1 hypothetical protein BXY58_1544 [Epilithonimonas arachidiradicis]GGG49234.1 hypothetical protein GCM10007332_08460 [Epilithonimonas arachidiradicis]
MQNITQIITKYSAASMVAIFTLSLQSCSESPDKFFGIAVLNTNIINDFATPTLAKHINDETVEFADIPSSKNKADEAITFVNNKIAYLEKSLNDIKALNANSDDRKAIKEKSVALYEYVIPVYKNEYTNYAKLCDSKADQAKKDEIINVIEQKYAAKFEQMYIDLMDDGKAFAKENNLNVNWGN